jgi:prephenate dehydrogenase
MIKTIGIIGGSGEMGQMFGRQFELSGLQVLRSDRFSISSEQDLVKSSDVVIVSVPLGEGVPVIQRIAPYLSEDQVLSDFSSVKTNIIPEMQKTKACVISSHPMFGKLKDLKGQNLIVLPVRPGHFKMEFEQLFEVLGLNVVTIDDWEQHDKLMSYVQGLMHFFHIVFTNTMRSKGVDLSALLSMCSPVYKANFAFTCRILQRDPHLYTHILMDNPENMNVLNHFVEQAKESIDLLENRDEQAFINDFLENREYLKEHGKEFSQQSDYLIDQMKLYTDNLN